MASRAANSQCQIVESAAMLNLQQQQQERREKREGNKTDQLSLSIMSTPSKSCGSLTNGDMPFKVGGKEVGICSLV
jgi:hypothetical protein